MGQNSEEFCTKWCEIVNKASLDLRVLVIEYTLAELSNTQRLITEIQQQIRSSKDDATFKNIEEELKNGISKYREKTQIMKIHKVKRDTLDYKDNKIYKWRAQNPFPGSEYM